MDRIDQKREEILDAAMLCLARYGAIKSTMDDIAKVMGLKKASLYYYYKNKEAIFTDAFEREVDRFFEKVSHKIDALSSATEKIQALTRFKYEYFTNRAEMLEFNLEAMIDNHALFRTISEKIKERNRDFLADLISEAVKSGEFRKVDPQKTAEALRVIFNAQLFEMIRTLSERKPGINDCKLLEIKEVFILDILFNGLKTHKDTDGKNI